MEEYTDLPRLMGQFSFVQSQP